MQDCIKVHTVPQAKLRDGCKSLILREGAAPTSPGALGRLSCRAASLPPPSSAIGTWLDIVTGCLRRRGIFYRIALSFLTGCDNDGRRNPPAS